MCQILFIKFPESKNNVGNFNFNIATWKNFSMVLLIFIVKFLELCNMLTLTNNLSFRRS